MVPLSGSPMWLKSNSRRMGDRVQCRGLIARCARVKASSSRCRGTAQHDSAVAGGNSVISEDFLGSQDQNVIPRDSHLATFFACATS